MDKLNWSELESFLHPTGSNTININHTDLATLIVMGELVLTTKSGTPLYLLSDLDNIPKGVAIVDSDYYNTFENSKEVKLP